LQQLFRSIVGPRFAAELVELGDPVTVVLWEETKAGTEAKRMAAMLFMMNELLHRGGDARKVQGHRMNGEGKKSKKAGMESVLI